MTKLLAFCSALSICAAARIEINDFKTNSQTAGCEICSGVESACCVETNAYNTEITAIRCYDPAIDVCPDGVVCPVSKPSVCFQMDCMGNWGDTTCFNPETHACIAADDGVHRSCIERRVCAIGWVMCGTGCHQEGSGVCCGGEWYRAEENKRCCTGSCTRGCDTWTCNADQECMSPWDDEFSNENRCRLS